MNNECLAAEHETANETFDLARQAAERRFATSSDRCPYCDTKQGDEDGGLHLLFDWEDMQPGDVLWDGERWMPCRHCNWKDGRPVRVPEGAIVMEGERWHPTAHWSVISLPKEAINAVPNL